MQNANSLLIALACVSAIGALTPTTASGQLAQAVDDYKHDRPLQYAPSDPWTRSRLFNQHIKHAGWFYNCDGEQCKRNSPYIFWKTHQENDLPARTPWWQRVNQTVAEVKQRIADGGCADGSCDPAQTTGCLECTDCSSSAGCSCTARSLQEDYSDHQDSTYDSCPTCSSASHDHDERLSQRPPTPNGGPISAVQTTAAQTETRDNFRVLNKPLQATRDRPVTINLTPGINRVAGLESLDTRIKNR